MHSTRKMIRKKERIFHLFKTFVDSQSVSTLSSNDIIFYSNSALTVNLRESQIPKDQIWCSRSDETVSPSYFDQSDQFYQSISTFFMLSLNYVAFLRYFFCLFFRCFCYFCLFSLWFSFLVKTLSLVVKMQP